MMKLKLTNDKPVTIKPLNTIRHYNTETHKIEDLVLSFILTNDNYTYCNAHTKYLDANEMLAIYEYMKEIMEKT